MVCFLLHVSANYIICCLHCNFSDRQMASTESSYICHQCWHVNVVVLKCHGAAPFVVLRTTVVPVNICPGDLRAGLMPHLSGCYLQFTEFSALWIDVDCGSDELRVLEEWIMRNCMEKDRKKLRYIASLILKLPVPTNFFCAARSACTKHKNEFYWPSLNGNCS